MDLVLTKTFDLLDICRSTLIKIFVRNDLLKEIFRNRSLRIILGFSAALIFNLVVSVCFPLWVLLVGPILFGTPHLISSLRYIPYITISKKILKLDFYLYFFSLMLTIFIFKLVQDHYFPIQNPQISKFNNLELLSFFASLIIFILIYPQESKIFRMLFLGLTIGGALIKYPILSPGIFLLFHNFVAFIYWIKSSQKISDKLIAIFSALIFLILNYFIFMGLFDFIYQWVHLQNFLNFGQMNALEIGKNIVAWETNYNLFIHATIAYAFGQSLHYFIWIKVIPQLNHYHHVSPSFKMSYKILKRDFKFLLIPISSLMILGSTFWFWIDLSTARNIYFALALFHGFFELAGLGLIKSHEF